MGVRCTGITKAGVQCAKIATRSLEEDGERLWCATHVPEGTEAVKSVPRCSGLTRNGMPCGSACEFVVVFRDEEVAVCRNHKTVHEASDGKSLQTPPKPRTPKTKRLAQETTLVGETKSNGKSAATSGSLRERLVTTTEEMYSQITEALEDVITNAKKRRATACPSCGHRFSVLIPDYGAIV